MKKFLGLAAALTMTACTSQGPNPNEVAAEAAQQYYHYLLQGNYAAFVDGHFQQDSIPSTYRSQLIDNAKMFMAQQKEEHGGLKEVTKIGAEVDTLKRSGRAFLQLHYGDSTRTKIVVPLVYFKGIWYLE